MLKKTIFSILFASFLLGNFLLVDVLNESGRINHNMLYAMAQTESTSGTKKILQWNEDLGERYVTVICQDGTAKHSVAYGTKTVTDCIDGGTEACVPGSEESWSMVSPC